MRSPVIFDCDPGVDDALALCLCLAMGRDLVAVISSYGCSTVTRTTRNARRILDLAGGRQVPVLQGSSAPLLRYHPVEGTQRLSFFGRNGLNNVRLPATAGGGEVQCPAEVELGASICTILERCEAVDYFVTGPCTNLARACLLRPDLVRARIRLLAIMGGALGPGNSGTEDPGTGLGRSEFNLYLDPLAFRIVMDTGLQPRMVTWDEAKKFRLRKSAVAALTSAGEVGPRLVAMLRRFFVLYSHDTVGEEEQRGEPFVIISDPLVLLADNEFGCLEEERMAVVTSGPEFGRTLLTPTGMPVARFRLREPEWALQWMLDRLGIRQACMAGAPRRR